MKDKSKKMKGYMKRSKKKLKEKIEMKRMKELGEMLEEKRKEIYKNIDLVSDMKVMMKKK